MHSRLRERAIKLRIEEELSYLQIKKRLGVPKSTLSYWLREFPLSEERIKELKRKGWKKAEVKIERFRNTMRKKRKLQAQKVYNKYHKRFNKISEKMFFIAGLMLYLAEGNKKARYKIAFSNTDPKIIKFFAKWLVEFLHVNREEIKVQLHLYENMDIKKEKEFWRNELGFQENQFYKPEVRKLKKGSFSYRETSRHGTCDLYVMGGKRKRELMMAIQAFLDRSDQYKKGT